MKLRNKNTGEIIDAIFEPCEGNVKVINKDEPSLYGEYGYLSELNKEWEDYTPAEPLIKDEKIRKAVRAWWECCQEELEDKRIYIKDAEFRMGVYRLDLGRYYLFDDKKEGFYTLAELCGEEEE